MAKIHGRSGRLYVDLAGGAAASPVTNLTKWTFDAATDKVEGTSMGDANKNYLAGLPDAKGTFNGFYDDASPQTYTAASDGLARKFYLYPNTATAQYWFGTALFDFSATGGVSEAVAISGSWAAATAVAKVG